MERFDVLVVGGGPAGSTCARELVRAGLAVAVLDAKPFPRDKVCAGWITPQIVAELELDARDYALGRVLQPIRGFEVSLLGGKSARVTYPEVVSFGIRRCEFDAYLLARSGATLRLGEPLRSLAREGDEWLANGRVRARVLVGAGGHFCPVARQLAPAGRSDEPVVAAQEIEFELDAEQAARCPVSGEVPELFFERDLRGYAWLVRKGPVLNVGIGRQDTHDLAGHAQKFLAFCESRGKLPPRTPPKRHGHAYLLYGQTPRPLAGDGFVLVGDSAGLAWPQSGEGIRPAVESGLLAARAIAAKDLAGYARAMEARFGPRAGRRSTGWSELVPRALRPWLAEKLLARPAFARRVVVDGWFLHRGQAPLSPHSAA
ncbi:MAG TPA: NAD(P)/FAD-dependent oxidoreductase [Myxococcota bacterium]|nr:NAD(P)/FAD-dependent oxidoreductase [Myxococcota bacterium]